MFNIDNKEPNVNDLIAIGGSDIVFARLNGTQATVGAAPTSATYTVPAGKRLVVHSIFCQDFMYVNTAATNYTQIRIDSTPIFHSTSKSGDSYPDDIQLSSKRGLLATDSGAFNTFTRILHQTYPTTDSSYANIPDGGDSTNSPNVAVVDAEYLFVLKPGTVISLYNAHTNAKMVIHGILIDD